MVKGMDHPKSKSEFANIPGKGKEEIQRKVRRGKQCFQSTVQRNMWILLLTYEALIFSFSLFLFSSSPLCFRICFCFMCLFVHHHNIIENSLQHPLKPHLDHHQIQIIMSNEKGWEGYKIDKIIQKRVSQTEYNIKWQGWPDTQNTWIPEEELKKKHPDFEEALRIFEEKLAKKMSRNNQSNSSPGSSSSSSSTSTPKKRKEHSEETEAVTTIKSVRVKTEEKEDPIYAKIKGKKVEKIIGADHSSGMTVFFFKWIGEQVEDSIPEKIARQYFPNDVIDYLVSNDVCKDTGCFCNNRKTRYKERGKIITIDDD